MLKRILLLAVAIPFLLKPVDAQEIPAPDLTPHPTSEKHLALIREGVRLNDQGDLQGAIRNYQQVLAEDPDDVGALYELAYSLFVSKDYKKSLATASQGAHYRSATLPQFYILIGNNLDQLHEPDKAIAAYKSGLKLYPDDAQLHFNLAVTYLNTGKLDEAKKSLKATVASDPAYLSAHLGLGQLYQRDNYRVPALLAYCRFLVLEPRSPRSQPALERIMGLMQDGATTDAKGHTTLQVGTPGKTDEGDFGAVNMALSLANASRHAKKNEGKSEMQLTVDTFDTWLSVLQEVTTNKKSSGFAWNYYRPYFIELKRRNYVEPFCYYIHQSTGSAEVAKWLRENPGKLNEFLKWSKGYQWPKSK